MKNNIFLIPLKNRAEMKKISLLIILDMNNSNKIISDKIFQQHFFYNFWKFFIVFFNCNSGLFQNVFHKI